MTEGLKLQRKKLIEVALPLPEINDASAYDKMPGIGPHPKGIHHWWARLPLPTARAVLFASVVDDPSSHPDKFPTEEAQNAERERLFGIVRELMQKKLHEHPEAYAKARAEILKHVDGKLPPVLDPFSGGGSIPLEAARLGFEAHAGDLNPVAVLLNKCNLELIPRWLDKPSVNPVAREGMFGRLGRTGSGGLAEDVQYYGSLIKELAIKKVGHLYPKVKLPKEFGGSEANAVAWLWARTIKCPNPGCGARAPLVRSFWLCRKKPNYFHAKPVIKGETVSFSIETKGQPEKETTSGRGARCLFCGQIISKAQVRDAAIQDGVMEIPLAIVAEAVRGRAYLPIESTCILTASRPDAPNIEQDMTNDRRWFSPPLYGLRKFSDIFTPRQLTTMVTLSDLVRNVRQDVMRDALEAGYGTHEAEDYAKTVTIFLALALDRCVDFNNSMCRWEGIRQEIKDLFSRQAIPMVWDFVEGNPFLSPRSSWDVSLNRVVESLHTVCPHHGGKAWQLDAAGAYNVDGLLVSTDPPYYDNIGYAALSDFFYVWLRRTIGDLYPELFKTILVPKAPELTASPERFHGNREKAKEHFESGFRKTFIALREKMDHRFPLTVYYAFKQEDEKAGGDEHENGNGEARRNGVDRTTGWETFLDALLSSGFQITATWPVRASQKQRQVAMGTNALASYIVLACRARPNDAAQCSRRDFMNQLKKELPASLKHLQQGNIAPVDLAQASIGPGMAVFSRYAKVMESSGRPMTVRTVLNLINQALDEVLAEQEAEFDADTRWALAWFDQNGTEEGEFGVAETLSKAKNTAVKGLVEAGIVSARGGKVRLVKRDELPDDWDPTDDKRLTVWEATQHLIRALDQHGESGAADLLRKVGGGLGENARELSYRLHKICERKGWPSEALAYNGLVLAWPELTKLAHSGHQGTLFE